VSTPASVSSYDVHEIAFECFGVRIGVSTNDPRVRSQLRDLVPPHTQPCEAAAVEQHFSVATEDGGAFTVRCDVRDGVPARDLDVPSYIATDVDLSLALGLLEDQLHSMVAYRAVDRIFINAGAVGFRGRMIVMPAAGLTGKSTLVAALVRAGATYYSDRYAVLDEEGRVHPYATPLRLDDPGGAGISGDGRAPAVPGEEPLPLGAVVMTGYHPGAEWQPRQLSAGESVLALMSQTVPGQDRPESSMQAIRRALEAEPVVLSSERDEAEPVARALLAGMDRQFPASG
jgi:hypothetical protein